MNTAIAPYLSLMRLEKPIGSLLLLWPTWSALLLANQGMPRPSHLMIFTAGVFIMRSAGCVANDLADQNFDRQVRRTQGRPLASGSVSPHAAKRVLLGLLLFALALWFALSPAAQIQALIALVLAMAYPFAKRFTDYPQVVLGLAYGWSQCVVFAEVQAGLNGLALLCLLQVLIWAVVFDTPYAMVDRDDDEKIGVRSTARRWGDNAVPNVMRLQALLFGIHLLIGWAAQLHVTYYVGLCGVAVYTLYQWQVLRRRASAGYFEVFLSHNRYGALLFLATLLGVMI